MQALKNIPIRRKVTLVILLTTITALLVAGGALLAFQLLAFRQDFRRDLSALAQIIASHSTAAVAFNDKKAAAEMLAALKAKPHIAQAQIRLEDGTVFARYGQEIKPSPRESAPTPEVRFVKGYLLHSEPIVLDGDKLGTLDLRARYAQAYWNLLQLYAEILMVVLSFAILLALLLSNRLQRVISAPILSLAKTAKKIADEKDYSVRVAKLEEDEIGTFTDAFNQMLEQIQARGAELLEAKALLEQRVLERTRELQDQMRAKEQALARLAEAQDLLMDLSRQSGMAEIATGVLHNVGNVLNSVNVSSNLITDRLRGSRGAKLSRAAALMQAHAADLGTFITTDPKGKLLPEYFTKLAAHLEEERSDLLREAQQLVKNVDHIKEIVAMQQSYAQVAGLVEDLPAAELVEDAVRLHTGAFLRRGITIRREYQPAPPVRVDKHKVLQILINLLRNACQALEAGHATDKTLTLGIARGAGARIQVIVRDNGAGIPPEHLTRIFQHGFTTKANGHGFGLHSGALAAKEMGGALYAASDGPGRGATFILELPTAKGNA